ncbi:uncharacterized protein METZ01_LOCUS498172 [marine metagenome]|uniref:Uncharacterized protein n=1 Tax=marine metagenome TaxID=408172 RepID=A0A383DN89_9ZZZZ
MISKVRKYFLEYLNTKKREDGNKIPEFTYLQMIVLLKDHYRYEAIINGQMSEKRMNRRLSPMSFDEIKKLFDSVLKIEMEKYNTNYPKDGQ